MKVVLFGDSVFAGYGLAPDATPAAQLREMRPKLDVIAAGILDEMSADGLARIDDLAGDVVLVEFGLNDAIEGVPPEDTTANLCTITERLLGKGAAVVIVEALVPTGSNWPALVDHTGLAAGVAQTMNVELLRDIIALAGGDRQDDGLHPNTVGARRIATAIADMLDRTPASSSITATFRDAFTWPSR